MAIISPLALTNFIFSNSLQLKLGRHLLFWCAYLTFFHFQNNNRTVLYLISFFPGCVFMVYAFGYFLFPSLIRKKYWRALSQFVITYFSSLILEYLGSRLFFSYWDDYVNSKMIIGLMLHNHVIALSMGAVAIGIKATKTWHMRHVETMRLQEEKVRNELMLRKTELYPEFIVASLRTLKNRLAEGTIGSSDLVLKLSNSLSYILYDSVTEFVALKNEIRVVRDLVDLTKNSVIPSKDVVLSISGSLADKYITPLTLFRSIQNVFQVIKNQAVTGIIDIRVSIDVAHDSAFCLLTLRFDQRHASEFVTWMTTCKNEFVSSHNIDVKMGADDSLLNFWISTKIPLASKIEVNGSFVKPADNVMA